MVTQLVAPLPEDTSMEDAISGPTLVDMLDDGACGTGTVLFAETDDHVKISELWDDAERYARWIRDHAGTGGRIGVLLENRRDVVTALLGIWRSGNTVVSLPHRAPHQDPEEWRCLISRMCDLADVSLIFAPGPEHVALVESGTPVYDYADADAGGSRAGVTAGAGGVIQFTSGSTSSPKGVILSSTAIGSNVAAIAERIQSEPGDVAVSWLPLSHDMGLIGTLLTALTSSTDLVMMTPKQFMFNPARWLRTCSAVGATATVAPNFALDLAVRAHRPGTAIDLSRLRLCLTGSERVGASTLRTFAETFEPCGFESRALSPAYGMAECSLAVTMVAPGEHWTSSRVMAGDGLGEDGDCEIVSNGRPVTGIELRIDTPADRIGEIQVRGNSLLQGYLGAETLWTHDGWFRTRDLGFLEGGECFVIGRSDEVIIVRGCNYFPEDVETATTHPSLQMHGVAAVPWGTGGLALIAEVTKKAIDLRSVGREVASAVGRRTGVAPSLVAFVKRGSLPRTPSGKIQRTRARRQIIDGTLAVLAEYKLETS